MLVNGVAKAIKESKAIKIYINNIMTEFGQTDNYSVADHIKAIIEHCGEGLIDYCIYDTGEVIPEYIKKYNKEGADLVEQNLNDPKIKKIKFIKKNISTIIDGKVRHDPYMVAESAIKLICNDLKYEDREDDPEYVMLNAKLKSDKRINKIRKCRPKWRKKNKENNKTKIKNLLEKVNLIQNIVIEYNLLENLMKNSEEIIKNRGGKWLKFVDYANFSHK